MSNIAAWSNAKAASLEVGPAKIPTPGEGELVIEVGNPHTPTQHKYPNMLCTGSSNFAPPRQLEAPTRPHPN